MDQREKAAYIVGIVDAFRLHGWPAECSPSDKAEFMQVQKHALQMLGEGVCNPIHAYEVLGLANKLQGLASAGSVPVPAGG